MMKQTPNSTEKFLSTFGANILLHVDSTSETDTNLTVRAIPVCSSYYVTT